MKHITREDIKNIEYLLRKKYSKEDMLYLMDEYRKGTPIQEIAKQLNRTERAIKCKILNIENARLKSSGEWRIG